MCRKKLNVIFNGVDIQEYENTSNNNIKRSDLGIPDDAFVVGMVGRLAFQKAPDIFIEMAKCIKEQIPNAHFIIVGNGDMQEQVEEYAKKYGFKDALHITGWVDNPLDYVKLFDVATLLSRWEGFGLAIPEYMMCQKPVVATAVDAIPNLITDHKNGLLVPMENPDAAYNAVMEVYRDEKLKKKIVKQGSLDVYDKFDVRRVSNEHEKLFVEILK